LKVYRLKCKIGIQNFNFEHCFAIILT